MAGGPLQSVLYTQVCFDFISYDMSTLIIIILNFIDHKDKFKPTLNFNNFTSLILSKTSLLR